MANVIQKEFPKKYMLSLLYGDIEEEHGKIIDNQIVDHSRWSVIHEIIFKNSDGYWRTNYSVGATESQDESPFEHETVVMCTKVEPKLVQTCEYVPVRRSD